MVKQSRAGSRAAEVASIDIRHNPKSPVIPTVQHVPRNSTGPVISMAGATRIDTRLITPATRLRTRRVAGDDTVSRE